MSEPEFSNESDGEPAEEEEASSDFEPEDDGSDFVPSEEEPPKKRRRVNTPKRTPRKAKKFASPPPEHVIQVGKLKTTPIGKVLNSSEMSLSNEKPGKAAESIIAPSTCEVSTTKSLSRLQGEEENETTVAGENTEKSTPEKSNGGSPRKKTPITKRKSDEYGLVLRKSKFEHLLLEFEAKTQPKKGEGKGEKVREINLEADTGIIGVLKATPTELFLDLQGTRYKGHFEETATMMLVNLGNSGGVGTVQAVLQSVVRCSETGKSLDVTIEGGEEDDTPTVFKLEIDVNRDTEKTDALVSADQAKAQIAKKKLKSKTRGKGRKKKKK